MRPLNIKSECAGHNGRSGHEIPLPDPRFNGTVVCTVQVYTKSQAATSLNRILDVIERQVTLVGYNTTKLYERREN